MDKSQPVYVPVILGTARKGRESEKVARFVYSMLKQRKDIKTQYIDVRKFVKEPVTMPDKTKKTKDWVDVADHADGFLIISPEYNHGYPGELKLLLDQAYEEYKHKPVALCTVSSGHVGGARLAEHLQSIFNVLGLKHTGYLYFPHVESMFDAKGNMQDAKYKERVEKLIDMLVVYAEALREVRETLSARG